ncbi:hypothetical protein JXD20_02540 [Candidatus Peregrinibacteria bacterium]|nr:hypothetical protein [Candidatus Peregrinibacteria bacterium]
MRKITESRGSILIWTLLLGISLATVFFFFAQRLNSNVAAQRETIQYQNARLLFESYITYVQSLDSATLAGMRGDINFEGMITGTLTNEAKMITGVLDAGAEAIFTANFPNPAADKIKIEWDLCPPDDIEVLELDGSSPGIGSGGCTVFNYERSGETMAASFTLSAPAGPTHYRLTAINDATLYDSKWQLDIEYPIGFRKKLTTSINFVPES